MKTPRDWLLDRHGDAMPRLNALRRAALESDESELKLWEALFLPHRTAWRLIAATWVILLLFHFTIGRVPQASKLPGPPPALLAAFNIHDTSLQNDRLP